MSKRQSGASAVVVCDDAISGSESDKDVADELRLSMEAFDKRIAEVENEQDLELCAEFRRIEECRRKNLEVAKTHFQCRLKSIESEHEFDVRASNNEADSSRIAAKESLVKTLKDCKNRLHFEYLGTWLYEDESSRVTRASRTKKDGSDPSGIVSLSRNDDNPVSRVNSLQHCISLHQSAIDSDVTVLRRDPALLYTSQTAHDVKKRRVEIEEEERLRTSASSGAAPIPRVQKPAPSSAKPPTAKGNSAKDVAFKDGRLYIDGVRFEKGCAVKLRAPDNGHIVHGRLVGINMTDCSIRGDDGSRYKILLSHIAKGFQELENIV